MGIGDLEGRKGEIERGREKAGEIGRERERKRGRVKRDRERERMRERDLLNFLLLYVVTHSFIGLD